MINRIAIIGAMDSEIEYLKNVMEKEGTIAISEINKYTFYFGKIQEKEIILVKSGVGRVNAAVLMTILYTHFRNIDKIINIGIAGGYEKLHIGDIVICQNSVYGDVDITCASDEANAYKYGQMSGCPQLFKGDLEIINIAVLNNLKFHLGTIITCDKFTTSYNESKELIDKYFYDLNILAFDMESAAFAQCAYMFNLPFIAIRAISDVIGGEHQSDEYNNCFEESSKKSNLFLIELLKKL